MCLWTVSNYYSQLLPNQDIIYTDILPKQEDQQTKERFHKYQSLCYSDQQLLLAHQPNFLYADDED